MIDFDDMGKFSDWVDQNKDRLWEAVLNDGVADELIWELYEREMCDDRSDDLYDEMRDREVEE